MEGRIIATIYHIHDYHHCGSSAGEQANVSSLYEAVYAQLPAASRLLIEKGESIYSVVSGLHVYPYLRFIVVFQGLWHSLYEAQEVVTHTFECLFVDMPTCVCLTDCVRIL